MNNYANNVAQRSTIKKITLKDITDASFFIFIFICFGWLIMNSDTVSALSKNGAVMALLSVMPSTFPYLVLSGLIIKGGLADLAGRLLSPLARFYKLSAHTVCAVFVSLITGFPVPASMAYSLYLEGKCSISDGEGICGFCSFCGPPFIISLFGVRIIGDIKAGMVLFGVQCVLALIFGRIIATAKSSNVHFEKEENKKNTDIPLCVLICKSITEGGQSMLKIFSFVIFFSIFSGFCESLILWAFPHTPKIITSLIRGFLEISSGISSLSTLDISQKLKFILGGIYIYWSGLSVFFQVSSSANGIFSMKKYLLGRVFMILIGVPLAFFIYFYLLQ